MKKHTADILAIALAARIIDTDPKVLAPFSGGPENADDLANFIQRLSARLQDDIDDTVSFNNISFLTKN